MTVSSELKPITFLECLTEAFLAQGMLEGFAKLTGHRIQPSLPRNGLEALIDQATGYQPLQDPELEASMRAFAIFVRETVWERLDPALRAADCWVPQGPLLGPNGVAL